MNLKTFLRELGTDEKRAAFARRCDTSIAYLRMIAYNSKTAGESLAVIIERESGGIVTIEEIRPDFSALLRDSGYMRQAA